MTFKRLDNGETNVTGIFNDLLPGQSYDFEISWNGEAVDTYTYSVSSVVDNTPPTLNCTSESFTFDLEDDPSPTLTLDDLTTADPVDADCTVTTFEIQGYGASRTFSCDDAGTNTLTVVAIDQAGNTNTCNVDVEITGAYPEGSGMFDLDVYLDENGTATLSDSDLLFASNLSTPCFTQAESEANYSVPIAYQNFSCNDLGTTSFLLDSADPSFPDANQTVIVIDSTPVRASVADVIVVLDESGVGTQDESDLVFTVSDNCYTDAEIEAGYSIPSEFNTFDCTQIGVLFITLDKNNNDFPEVILQVTVESTDLSFDPIVTDFCANSSFDLTSLEDQITTASGTFTYTQSIERLYVPNGNDNNVSVIDLASNSVIATIDVGTRPQGVGVHPDGEKVYIMNFFSNDVSVIDVASNTVEATIDVGLSPIGTAFNADGSRLYVTNSSDNNISVINTATNAVVNTITTGRIPWGIALSPDDSKIYIANQSDDNVSVINANTGATITSIGVQNIPYDVALSADGTKMYVGNASGLDINNSTQGAINIIDISTDVVIETIFTAINYQDAYDFAVQPTGNLYTSHLDAFGGSINRLEPNNGNAITYYEIENGVSNEIQGISLNEDGSILYLVDRDQDKVIFFNTLTNTEGMSIAVGDVRWCVGEFYVKTTLDIADPMNYVPNENEVIDVAFDGGAECESTTTITFTTGDGCKLFVNADANLGGDGTSWTTAFKYLQDAIALANTDDVFSEIWVAQGVYYPDEDEAGNVVDNDESASFQLLNEIYIFGGFNGTETMVEQRDVMTYTTILSGDIQQNDTNTDDNNIAEQTNDIQGDNSDHVVTGSSTNNTAILDGFTITAGQADGVGTSNTATGAGMLNISGSPTLRNLRFIGNDANVIGGGMYNNTFSDPTLTNVSFIGNSSNDNGGALANRQQSDPILTNVVFSRNTAVGDGGALHNATGTNPTLINVSFSQNTAMGDGGGIYNINSDPMITNSIFYGNTADGSGNSIGRSFLGSAPIISYSYFDDASLPTGSIDDGNNLLGQVDPFVDAASDDLQLVAFSTAIDTGDNSQNSTTEDVANNARNYDDANVTDTGAGTAPIIDMGAFERQTDSEDNCLSDPITLSGSETSTTDYITQAEITSTQSIESGSTVLYQAGTTITLGIGFHAKSGSNFTAKIEDCAAQNSTDEVVENRTEETSWADSNEVVQDLQLEVFPNPFSSSTNIQFHLTQASDVTLIITNMNGQVIHRQQYLNAPSGWQQHQFDASHLPAGMYFLQIRTMEQQTVKQLIIQK